ncbi:daptomycin-sensing surface protein LiaX [Enterococcus hermanniensis]|uniref:DUF4097 domain-containing protein n=1 Tax=Enterococcus hermanniensis TaxID=249189 RepID=A0A1L8TPY4_9ENTE|nr:daptomycin-sensing surface protein LiaX [Enterococcus hermanniensis]OJG46293.1 hypothetical protein RV04_GL001459 [Enterococcus hermanniensis]
MNQREQILTSIKKGILTPEEGLDFLEHLETTASESFTDKTLFKTEQAEDAAEQIEEEVFHEELNTEAPQVDATTSEETIFQQSDSVTDLIDAWEKDSFTADSADPVTSTMEEFDQTFEQKKAELRTLQEEYHELNLESELGIITKENELRYEHIQLQIKDLEKEIQGIKDSYAASEEDFFTSTSDKKEQPDFFGIPDDFDEQSYRPSDLFEEAPQSFNNRLERFVVKASKKVETLADKLNREQVWKNSNHKFGFKNESATQFSRRFSFDDVYATSIDIKVAKGKVQIKTWDKPDVEVEAKIKLLGEMDQADPLDAFLERSQIDIEDHQILFHVPNKRVEAQLTFYLPKRQYDETIIRMLSGDVSIEGLTSGLLSIKSTLGDLMIKESDVSRLKIKGTTNKIEILTGQIADAEIETVDGKIISKAVVSHLAASLINGDIKLTLGNESLRTLTAHTIKGDVKVALPKTVGIEGTAKTVSGTINERFDDYETVFERNERTQKIFHFRRVAKKSAIVDVSSKAGSVYLKDYEGR